MHRVYRGASRYAICGNGKTDTIIDVIGMDIDVKYYISLPHENILETQEK